MSFSCSTSNSHSVQHKAVFYIFYFCDSLSRIYFRLSERRHTECPRCADGSWSWRSWFVFGWQGRWKIWQSSGHSAKVGCQTFWVRLSQLKYILFMLRRSKLCRKFSIFFILIKFRLLFGCWCFECQTLHCSCASDSSLKCGVCSAGRVETQTCFIHTRI